MVYHVEVKGHSGVSVQYRNSKRFLEEMAVFMHLSHR